MLVGLADGALLPLARRVRAAVAIGVPRVPVAGNFVEPWRPRTRSVATVVVTSGREKEEFHFTQTLGKQVICDIVARKGVRLRELAHKGSGLDIICEWSLTKHAPLEVGRRERESPEVGEAPEGRAQRHRRRQHL